MDIYNFLKKVATQNFDIFPEKSIFGDFFLRGGKSIFSKILRETRFFNLNSIDFSRPSG